jgi:ParB-like chromosome segregation protein Spo0J
MSAITIEEGYHKLVRPLSEKEYSDLRESMKTHGQLVPITVNQDGVILDGHNRFNICQELGIAPVVVRREFQNKAAEKLFVIESNLKRRHLTDIEKVELGMQLEALEKELASERMLSGKPSVKMTKGEEQGEGVSSNELGVKGQARDIAAKKVELSPTTYHRGKTVLEKGSDEIKEQVKEGKTSISAAYEKVKGRDKKPKKQALESSDILMLPEDKYQATKDAIDEAIAVHDKQVVLRHNKHQVTGVGKEIEISTN